MKNTEKRIERIEESLGLRKMSPEKVVFEVIGEGGGVIKSEEIEVKYDQKKNCR